MTRTNYWHLRDANSGGRILKSIAAMVVVIATGSCRLTPSFDVVSAPKVRPNNSIVFGIVWEPVGFYPLRAIDSGSYYAQSLVYEGLVKYDVDLNLVPALAKSFLVSQDGLTYIFALRENLRFSDGTHLGLNDVIQSFKLAIARGSPFRSDYKDVASYGNQGKDRFVVKLTQPNSAFLSRLAELKILPARVLSSDNQGLNVLMRHPIGTGPFMLTGWETGLELIFKPNPYYWGEHPRLDALIWRVIPDKALLALALNRGEIDVASIDAESWTRLLMHNDRMVLDVFDGSRTVYLGFNCAKEPFSDEKLREAVCLAIDKQSIAQALYGGYARVPPSDAPFGTWFFNAKARPLPYDPAAAKRLLKATQQIGLTTKAGFRIKTLRDFQDIAQVVSNSLNAVGIKSEVEILEYTTFKRRTLQTGDFTTFISSRSAGPDPECGIVWGPNGTLNYVRFEDKSLAALLEAGRHSLKREDRARVYGQVQQILAQRVPWDFLVQPKLLIVHARRCQNIKISKQNQSSLPWDNPLFNAPYWHIDREIIGSKLRTPHKAQ